MENSVDATIEKIKIQEQINDTKLREKREFDVTVASLNRSIRDTKNKAEKLKQETLQIQLVAENLEHQLNAQKFENNALLKQVNEFYIELNQLRSESERKIASVWQLRGSLNEAMKHVSESCDVRSLLVKSSGKDVVCNINKRNQQHTEKISSKKQPLQDTLQRREDAMNRRRNLMNKPEKDDEFVR